MLQAAVLVASSVTVTQLFNHIGAAFSPLHISLTSRHLPCAMPAPTCHMSLRCPSRKAWSDNLFRFGAAHSATWAVLAVVTWLLSRCVSGSYWNQQLIPEVFHSSLAAHSALSILPLSSLLTVLLAGQWVLAKATSGGVSRRRRSIMRVACAELGSVILFLYAISWASFYATGQFLGIGGVSLWVTNPVQLLAHVLDLEPGLLLAVPVGALATSVVLTSSVTWVLRNLSPLASRTATIASLVSVLICLQSLTSGQARIDESQLRVWDPEIGAQRELAEVYRIALEDRTDPVAHGIASIDRSRLRSREVPHVAITIPVDTPTVLSKGEYRTRVNSASIHRWNVVIVVVESLRSDELTPYGGHRTVMPNVERLARESRVYTRNITNATHSDYAAVVPLSGQYPLRSTNQRAFPERIRYPRVLIHDILKGFNYHTAVFSSQNEYWGGMYYFLDTGSIERFFHSESYRGSTYVPPTDPGFGDWASQGRHAGKIDDRFTVRASIAWLDSLYAGVSVSSDPFVMYMNLQNSHVPYRRPADFPPRFGSGRTAFNIGFNHFPRDSADAVRDIYDNSLAYVDSQVGRLIGHLKDLGLWDRTIFVLTGDHGEAFFEHGFAAHGNLPFAELARAPLLLHAPGLAPGRDDRPSQHVDVAPTILSILGLPPHPGFQGIDLTGKHPPRDRPQFVVTQSPSANAYSVVSGHYTLILNGYSGFVTVYNDSLDPGQKHDIARALPAVRDALMHKLDMWRRVQLQYYGDSVQQRLSYPPVLEFWTTPQSSGLAAKRD